MGLEKTSLQGDKNYETSERLPCSLSFVQEFVTGTLER